MFRCSSSRRRSPRARALAAFPSSAAHASAAAAPASASRFAASFFAIMLTAFQSPAASPQRPTDASVLARDDSAASYSGANTSAAVRSPIASWCRFARK